MVVLVAMVSFVAGTCALVLSWRAESVALRLRAVGARQHLKILERLSDAASAEAPR